LFDFGAHFGRSNDGVCLNAGQPKHVKRVEDLFSSTRPAMFNAPSIAERVERRGGEKSAMRILLSILFSAALISGAAAHSARLGAFDPARARSTLPTTEADLERAEHRTLLPRQDNLGDRLGIRDGVQDIFDRGDTRANGGFSATIDGRGAQLRLRW